MVVLSAKIYFQFGGGTINFIWIENNVFGRFNSRALIMTLRNITPLDSITQK